MKLKPRRLHAGWAWSVFLVALLPYFGYLIYPPSSRLGPVLDNDPSSFYLDMARSAPFILGLLLSPAVLLAACVLMYGFWERPRLRGLCVAAFALALLMVAWYITMVF